MHHAAFASTTAVLILAASVWPFSGADPGAVSAAGLRASVVARDQAPAPPALDPILTSVGRYLSGYGADLSNIVAEESYRQEWLGRATRTLRSDMVFLTSDPARWTAFRDVFEVDGRPVRDRDDRIARLMMTDPNPDAWQQAVRIAQESARFNLNVPGVSVNRTLNVPIVALLFFRTENQHRSRFMLERTKTIDGRQVAVVGFEEHQSPRMFASRDDAAMHGDATIDVASGAVLETNLTYVTSSEAIETGSTKKQLETTVTIGVVFADDPQVHLRVPISMDETYDAAVVAFGGVNGTEKRPAGHFATLRGHAAYAHFRRFDVTVQTKTTVN